MKSHRLYGSASWSESADTIRAAAFGILMDIAAPIVKHYRSDFYRDAEMFPSLVRGDGSTIYYAVRESGTWLTGNRDFMVSVWESSSGEGESYYRLDLRAEYSPLWNGHRSEGGRSTVYDESLPYGSAVADWHGPYGPGDAAMWFADVSPWSPEPIGPAQKPCRICAAPIPLGQCLPLCGSCLTRRKKGEPWESLTASPRRARSPLSLFPASGKGDA